MPSLQLYDTLLQLPLFQGLSHAELAGIVSRTKFGFAKVPMGETVVREEERCDKLYFLLNGTLESASHAYNRRYSVREEISSPAVLQPERLFGLTQHFTKTFKATVNCNFLTLDKKEVLKLSDEFMIFRLNLLNIISTVAQKRSIQPWRNTPATVREKIVRFFEQRTIKVAGEKHVKIRMEDLASEICDSRLNVSRELRRMQEEGLVNLSRGMIHIPRLERLLVKS